MRDVIRPILPAAKRAGLSLGCLLGLCASVFGSPVDAVPPSKRAQAATKDEPAPAEAPQDPVLREVERIGTMLANAEMRLRTGAAGVRAREGDDRKPLTPGRACCQDNLTHIDNGMKRVRAELQETSTCLERKRDLKGVQSLQVPLQAMRDLDEALRRFAEAPTKPRTAELLGGTRRVYFGLLDSVKDLPTCEDAAR